MTAPQLHKLRPAAQTLDPQFHIRPQMPHLQTSVHNLKPQPDDHHQVFEVLDYSGDGLFNIRQSANDALLRAYADGGVQKVQIHTGGVSYFTGGNVGIGTTSPSFPLSVGSNTNEARVEIGTSGVTTWQSNVYSLLTIGVSGSHAITQDGSANSQQWFNVYDTGNKYRAYAGYGGNWMFTASTGLLSYRNSTIV